MSRADALLAFLHASVVLGAALLVAKAIPRARPAARHGVLLAGILLVLLHPLARQAMPRWPVAWLGTIATSPSAQGGASDERGEIPADPLLAIWLAGAALVLTRRGAASVALHRRVASARPAPAAAWDGLGKVAAWESGCRRAIPIRLAGRLATSFVSGILAPVIVLPAAASEWSFERRRAVLLHECAHVRRRDCLARLAATVACALHWFHPLAWMAARRLRDEQESACDEAVIGCGTRPSTYAAALLEAARGGPVPSPAPAFGGAAPSALARRIVGILDGPVERARPFPARAAAATALLAIGSLLMASLAPSPPPGRDAPAMAAALGLPEVMPADACAATDEAAEPEASRAPEPAPIVPPSGEAGSKRGRPEPASEAPPAVERESSLVSDDPPAGAAPESRAPRSFPLIDMRVRVVKLRLTPQEMRDLLGGAALPAPAPRRRASSAPGR